MSVTIWILASIAALIVVLGVVALWMVKKKGMRHEPDYKTFFHMGLIWIIIFGGYSIIRSEFTMSGFFALGVVFLIVGLANKDKWKNAKPMTHNQKIGWYAALVGVIALMVGLYIFLP